MAKTHPPYAPEFRRQMVELVRAGRDPADLAREFEPSSQAIRNWVAQADLPDGRREAKPAADAGLSAAEREELIRLRRENKQHGPRPIWWTATSRQPARTSCGLPTSPMSRPRRASSIWRSSWMSGAAGSSAGRWPTICEPSWSWML